MDDRRVLSEPLSNVVADDGRRERIGRRLPDQRGLKEERIVALKPGGEATEQRHPVDQLYALAVDAGRHVDVELSVLDGTGDSGREREKGLPGFEA